MTNLFFTQDFSATQTAVDPIGSTNAADVNLLLPFNTDLVAGTSPAEYRVTTTGAAGSQVCTIQWKNVSDKAGTGTDTAPTQYSNFTFQVKLYEGSNNVEFVYGPTTASTNAATSRFPTVGIKGTNATSSVLGNKTTGAGAWSTTVFINGPYGGSTHNYRNAAVPDLGRTYRFVPAVQQSNDAAVLTVYTLTKLPIPQGTQHIVRALVSNPGTSAQTALTVTLNVPGANTVTNTQTSATLAPGASTTVSFAGFSPATAGTNTVTVSVPADANNNNNSQAATQVVNTSTYSYNDAAAPTSARGFGPSTTATSAFSVRYSASTSVSITQVRAFLVDFVGPGAGSTIGKTVYAVVLDPATGAVLGRSADYIVASADVAGTAFTTFTLTTPVARPAGDFLVGLAQTYQTGQTTQYFPGATQPELPVARTGAYYTSSISTPAAPTDVTTIATVANPAIYRFMIEAVTASTSAPACTPVSGLTAGSITQAGATITFTAPAGTGGYVVTYTPTGGTATTITPAPTGSPIVLTGLTSGTTYTVSVVTSCSAGANSAPVTTTFTTALPAPTYAILPVSESFEGPWVSIASVRDAPTASWRNTPATGDNSWRREDDGFASANWQYMANEVPTTNFPTPPYVTRFSTGAHSARFHTFGSATGLQGKLDLYVNMSGAGTKTLSFDYINPTGADQLQVFVSTDGGTTFGTTPVLTATTNTTFTAKTVVIASTSATTVVRFQATSDFGDDDLGIDNLQLRVITATQNAALAANVSVYPNPAHQRFTLVVPAGSLRTASASLSNALGQVVLTRQLNLPTAGGTTDFDVSNLAAGVYSLSLKAGNDLVVKRVVVE